MRRVRRLTVLMVVLAVAGCGSAGSQGDAFDLGQGNTVCIPAPDGGAVMIGDTMLRHQMPESIAIDDVSLVDADDLTLSAAYLVELSPEESLVGIRNADDSESMPGQWPWRVDATGAVLEPDEEFNLVLVVESHAAGTASAEAARIHYRTPAGGTFHQDTGTAMLVTRDDCEQALRER